MPYNKEILKLWAQTEIEKLVFRSQVGMIPLIEANVQIDLLKRFIDDFNLSEVNVTGQPKEDVLLNHLH